jgi:deoxyribonuclease-4
MNIGVHVSSAGDLSLAPLRAEELGCECFQIFSRPPQGGPAKPITDELAANYKANCKKFKLPSYIHTPYYINLASLDNRIYHGSISVIREELERGTKLGVKYLMTHLGSAKDQTHEEAMVKVTEGISQILKDYDGSTEFLRWLRSSTNRN